VESLLKPSILVGLIAAASCATTRPSPTKQPGLDAESCTAEALSSQEGKHGVQGSFAALNELFLETHAKARKVACESLASQRLVIRYSFGRLDARWRGKVLIHSFVLPESYHPVKDVSHAVLLTALLVNEQETADARERARRAIPLVDGMLKELRALDSPPASLIPRELAGRQQRLLVQTRDLLDALTRGPIPELQQRRYFENVREDLTQNLRSISAAVVQGLDRDVRKVREIVDREDPAAWNNVVVVVGVMHQARAREIGIQYFERLLDEPVGEGARNERRMVIAENRTSAPDQYGLLAAHLVDQQASGAIFGDPRRLQWDVLADDGGALDGLLPRRGAKGP
jgi:hypothetical protein